MTAEELEEFFEQCPVLYHMAMSDSWDMIREHGLLPTDRLLSLLDVDAGLREELTTRRRPESVDVQHPNVGQARIRDQIPLSDEQLERCLGGELKPVDWHKRLNERVFFWTSKNRLERLMCAGAYRKLEHLVLEATSRPIFEAYSGKI